MSAKSQLKSQQRQWAILHGRKPDSRGYLETVADNLFEPLSEPTRRAFEDGSGLELHDAPSRPAKMKALHSSSALAVNFFDRWVGKDATILTAALGLDAEITAIKFEEQYSTGHKGTPPNLDVALELANGHIVGIESKFSEWLTPKSKTIVPFKPRYFPKGQGLWEARSLPRAQQLAGSIHKGEGCFRYLNAPQLLKHALGLANQLGDRFSLYYVYLDWPGVESEVHREEIRRFSAQVDTCLRFRAMSYQDLFAALNNEGDLDSSYMLYIQDRYMSAAESGVAGRVRPAVRVART